eukprot:COSAG05_NODE_2937_length_2487_cov_2.595059_2_plen_102_part_00
MVHTVIQLDIADAVAATVASMVHTVIKRATGLGHGQSVAQVLVKDQHRWSGAKRNQFIALLELKDENGRISVQAREYLLSDGMVTRSILLQIDDSQLGTES